ncbi:MAG: hypothetical protein ACPHID_01650 [Thermoplasmatota archaeon]
MTTTMSEYATPTNTTNPMLNPRTYWRVSAFALTAVALLGIIINAVTGEVAGISGFLEFDWAHNILHVVLAAAAFVFGFGNIPGQVSKIFAIVFGFVYLGLGVLGLAMGMTTELFGIIGLELGENLVHVVLGLWALVAGFTARY